MEVTSIWDLSLYVMMTIPLYAILTLLTWKLSPAGDGAVFAMVPLIKHRMTEQIAGMVGAYGNVGAVLFLTVLSFVSPSIFFIVITAGALVVLIAVQFIEEPQGHMVSR